MRVFKTLPNKKTGFFLNADILTDLSDIFTMPPAHFLYIGNQGCERARYFARPDSQSDKSRLKCIRVRSQENLALPARSGSVSRSELHPWYKGIGILKEIIPGADF